MGSHTKGIHHITGLAGDAQRNATFYVDTLGMRLVKKSVNQDDPGTYHLFYGNASGDPGSGLTFFPWPMAVQGKPGVGEAVTVSLAVPDSSVEFWVERLTQHDLQFDGPEEKFGSPVVRFQDPDRLQLELVFDPTVNDLAGWSEGTVPEAHGIRGFWGTTLRLARAEPTANVLTEILGFSLADETDRVTRYTTEARIGGSVVIETSERRPSTNGRGIIHHVAFRARDDEDLKAMRQQVLDHGLRPTEVIDRHWFHSVYFRSPGGVLFEMATDGPGYDVDEDPDKLGEKLVLAPWLEDRREEIEAQLPDITV